MNCQTFFWKLLEHGPVAVFITQNQIIIFQLN